MINQGFPLWAVESDGRTYAVIGWDEHQYPFLLILGQPDAVPRSSLEHERFTYTTTDPTERPDAAEPSTELSRPSTEWSEGDIRVVLRHIADRLDVIGATAPARRIREILESPAGSAPDDLRQRMADLADRIEGRHEGVPLSHAEMARRIRQAMDK